MKPYHAAIPASLCTKFLDHLIMPSRERSNSPPILKLAVPSPIRRTFDYLPPLGSTEIEWQNLRPGIRLRVPFGSREVTAVLTAVSETSDLNPNKLKHAITLLDQDPLFSPALIRSFNWAAGYYQHPPGEVYSTLLPAKLRQGAKAELASEFRWISTDLTNDLDPAMLHRAPKQQSLLNFIIGQKQVTSKDCADAGYTSGNLRELSQKGLIKKIEIRANISDHQKEAGNPKKSSSIKPNPGQLAAINTITNSLDNFACHLLDGITGSGKTEVYLQVIQKVLERGKQALILVPEIGLTPQTIQRFKQRFTCKVVALHSGMNNSERLEGWVRAKSGDAKIIIGTRSAVFTPLAKPGVIIIDEEHDSSFKQQDGFKYSARDLGVVRAREENINIVLGSATPALETLHNAKTGKYSHLILNQRAGNASKPQISLLDLNQVDSKEGFSSLLIDLIQNHLDNEGQVLVFINRRGFAPALYCQECGFIFECKRCDAQLTVHKSPPALHCHHCESRSSLPHSCVSCHSKQLATRGAGTQKTEQTLQQQFAAFPVIRIDRDSTRTRNKLDSLLTQIQGGEPCILVGTQMLAKGHHFPKVTLVAVLDADNGLFSPDFRGQELMVQLLFQVAGRAGRAENPGQVVVQTRHSTHASLQALVDNNYHEITDLLVKERLAAAMPPFSFLAIIRADGPNFELPIQFLNQVHSLCTKVKQQSSSDTLMLHQPIPSPMEKRAGKYRAQLLLQAQSRTELQWLLTIACPKIESLKGARKIRWSVDVDPIDLI